MGTRRGAEPVLSREAVKQGQVKAAQQQPDSAHFWETATWTNEQKAKTLAPANKARDTILMDVHLKKESKLRRLTSFKGIRQTSKALSEKQIDEIDNAMLQRQINDEINHAEKQQRQWQSSNRTGNRAISFLNDFVEFAGQFSGILEIMKGVDQGYGGAGYAALSFFLAVAVNTKRKDDLVAEAILNLKNEYSRMVLISEIYPTPEMMAYITTVYKLGIEFMQDAAIHYSRPTWRRLWDSLVRPPFLLDRKVKEISAAMTQIVKERDTLLSKRVGEISQDVQQVNKRADEISQDVQQVKIEVTELHTDLQKQRLAILNLKLSRYRIQPDKTVGEYSALLSTSFNRPPGLARFSLDMIRTEKSYVAWKGSKANCMLVLNGRTAADQTSFCWLSPASVEIAATLRREARDYQDGSRVAVVELYCQKTDFMRGNVKPMSAIVYLFLQLLEEDLTILRDAKKFEDLYAHLTNMNSESNTDFDCVCGLLVEVIQQFDAVYFIIDRVDRISGKFMEDFLKNVVLGRTNAKVRTLCVASRDQDMAKKIDELSEEMDEKNFITLQIDQSDRKGRIDL